MPNICHPKAVFPWMRIVFGPPRVRGRAHRGRCCAQTASYEAYIAELAAAVEEAQAKLAEDAMAELKVKEECARKLVGSLSMEAAAAAAADATAAATEAAAADAEAPPEAAAEPPAEAPAAEPPAAEPPAEPLDHLAFLRSRRECKPDVFLVLKAVMALLSPDARALLPAMSWPEMQAGIVDGSIPWEDLLNTVGSFDVMASADAEGFDGAAALLQPVDAEGEQLPPLDAEALKANSLLAFVLLEWFKAGQALFVAKIEKEKADAEAAAAAAVAAAEAAAADAAAAEVAAEEPAAE